MKKIINLLLIVTSLTAIAQRRTCGTNDIVNKHLQANPELAPRYKEMNDFIHNTNNPQTLFRQPNAPSIVVTIPVVFHVLYKNAAQNISDAQINSQLDALNRDYRKLNTDFNAVVPAVFRPLGADMEIVFCKATRTPSGAASTGITRKSVSSSFNVSADYYTSAGEPSWDNTRYLNVWIGRLSGGVLGFALPPSIGLDYPAEDGLVIGDQYCGTVGTAAASGNPFNLGRTAVHEIGHYFGLFHMWGNSNDPTTCGQDNDDMVADTPATDNPHYNCPSFPSNANTCTTTANGAMFMNYMDYVNDACMAFFTAGQKTVVQNTLAGPRLSLLSSNGCASLGLNEVEAVKAIAVYPNPVSKYFMITSPQVSIDEVEIFNELGQLIKTQKLTQANNVINIEELQAGIYYLRIYNEGQFLKSDKIIKN